MTSSPKVESVPCPTSLWWSAPKSYCSPWSSLTPYARIVMAWCLHIAQAMCQQPRSQQIQHAQVQKTFVMLRRIASAEDICDAQRDSECGSSKPKTRVVKWR